MTISPWKIIKSKYLIKDRWLTLRSDRCVTPDHQTVDPYYVLETVDWVNIVPIDFTGHILINKQYRHGTGSLCHEIPCGMIDDSDSSASFAAERELLEETGYGSKNLIHIGNLYANPARQTTLIYNFIAMDIQYLQPPEFDDTESIESELFTIPDVYQLIEKGHFNHGLHVASLFLAFNYLKRLKHDADIQMFFSPDLQLKI